MFFITGSWETVISTMLKQSFLQARNLLIKVNYIWCNIVFYRARKCTQHRLINKWRLAGVLSALGPSRKHASVSCRVDSRNTWDQSWLIPLLLFTWHTNRRIHGRTWPKVKVDSFNISWNEIRSREHRTIRRNGERNSLAISVVLNRFALHIVE